MKINLEGVDKAEVLASLYNRSKPLGMGFFHAVDGNMDAAEARDLLSKETYFDYLKGRVMKVSFRKDVLDTRLYDRDNGNGAAYKAIAHLLPENAVLES